MLPHLQLGVATAACRHDMHKYAKNETITVDTCKQEPYKARLLQAPP